MSRLILPCKGSALSKTCLMGLVSSTPVITLSHVLATDKKFCHSFLCFLGAFSLSRKCFSISRTLALRASCRGTRHSVKNLCRYRQLFCSEACTRYAFYPLYPLTITDWRNRHLPYYSLPRATNISRRLICSVATEPVPTQVEESIMDTPKEIFLKDYKQPDY
ncbi:UNVERIFIED_CONTAM: hypothetical protein Sindi_0020500 [Sesamum indicum]